MQQKWFKSWFNSPYYHILYSGRNHAEAEGFIDNLAAHLSLPHNAKVLDIACGKGRHAIYLHKKGLDVTGIDLSENSIRYAKQFEDDTLHFLVHDMRKLMYINYFDLAVNLFTSFGYFETDNEHVNALKAFRKGLKADGLFVLDYFNVAKVINDMVPCGEKEMEGIQFNIEKTIEAGRIIKTISFKDQGKAHTFRESVAAYTRDDFSKLLATAGLTITETFGDYNLNEFHEGSSDRLILVCRKS